MPLIEILNDTAIGGQFVSAGEQLEVDAEISRTLVRLKQAKVIEGGGKSAEPKPLPKFTRVPKKGAKPPTAAAE